MPDDRACGEIQGFSCCQLRTNQKLSARQACLGRFALRVLFLVFRVGLGVKNRHTPFCFHNIMISTRCVYGRLTSFI